MQGNTAVMFAFVEWRGDGDQPGTGGGDPIVAENANNGLPSGFEIPIDVATIAAVAERGVNTALGKEAGAIVNDVNTVREFFVSRVSVVGGFNL